jgi:hypothetical protein
MPTIVTAMRLGELAIAEDLGVCNQAMQMVDKVLA